MREGCFTYESVSHEFVLAVSDKYFCSPVRLQASNVPASSLLDDKRNRSSSRCRR